VQIFREPEWEIILTLTVDWTVDGVTWTLVTDVVTTAVWEGVERADE
jgi:hypothetical protein